MKVAALDLGSNTFLCLIAEVSAACLQAFKKIIDQHKPDHVLADVILVGVLILLATLAKFKKEYIIVSTRGVRHGIALEMARRFSA